MGIYQGTNSFFTMPNIFGGEDIKTATGRLLESTHENIFGGLDIQSPNGANLGHTTSNIFGGQTYFDPAGKIDWSSTPNISGGYDFSDTHHGLFAHSTPNIMGGVDIFDTHSAMIHTTPNIFGGSNSNWNDIPPNPYSTNIHDSFFSNTQNNFTTHDHINNGFDFINHNSIENLSHLNEFDLSSLDIDLYGIDFFDI